MSNEKITYKRTTETTSLPTHYAHVEVTEADEKHGDFTYIDTMRATWVEDKTQYKDTSIGWWLVSGDNSGTGNSMIMYPYMIDSMIELLQKLKDDPHSAE